MLNQHLSKPVTELLLYKILPEVDFVWMAFDAMAEHDYDPNRVLDGEAVAAMGGGPQEQPVMPEQAAAPPQQGALGGLMG
jgi:hypothetical protein